MVCEALGGRREKQESMGPRPHRKSEADKLLQKESGRTCRAGRIISKKTLLKLGYFNSEDDRSIATARMVPCRYDVGGFTITGFQEGTEMLQSLIEIDGRFNLPLDVESLGELLGMDYGGIPIPKSLSIEQKKDLLCQVACSKSINPHQVGWVSAGIPVESLKTEAFRGYVLLRRKQLCASESKRRKGGIPVAHAYVFKREWFDGEIYNWMKYKVDIMEKMLTRQRKTLGPLIEAFLLKYITAAQPALSRLQSRRFRMHTARDDDKALGSKRRIARDQSPSKLWKRPKVKSDGVMLECVTGPRLFNNTWLKALSKCVTAAQLALSILHSRIRMHTARDHYKPLKGGHILKTSKRPRVNLDGVKCEFTEGVSWLKPAGIWALGTEKALGMADKGLESCLRWVQRKRMRIGS